MFMSLLRSTPISLEVPQHMAHGSGGLQDQEGITISLPYIHPRHGTGYNSNSTSYPTISDQHSI
jgi:hypothetical protein